MSSSKTRANRGFTLAEVIIALAILGVVAIIILDQRIQVVRDADDTRDRRVGWTLAAWKMGEIERDMKLFEGNGEGDSGGFEDLATDYTDYAWSYEAAREDVPTNDPDNPDEKPKQIFRVKLKVVKRATDASLVEIEGLFPVREAEAPK
jgi:prepilin-type N-terminal cleavage/methylation domain-containing protein